MKFIPNIEIPPPPPFWSEMGDLNREILMGRPYTYLTGLSYEYSYEYLL